MIVLHDLPSLHAARKIEDERILRFVDGLVEEDFDKDWDYKTLEGKPVPPAHRTIIGAIYSITKLITGVQAHGALTAVCALLTPNHLTC